MGESFLEEKHGPGNEINPNATSTNYYVYRNTTVNEGDFIEFITGVAGQTTNSYTNSATAFNSSAVNYIAVTKLSTTKMLIAYRNNTDGYLYARVASLSNATVTFGTAVSFPSAQSASYIDVTYLSSSSAVVSYISNYDVYAVACTISGTTITFGTEVKVYNGGSASTTGYTTLAPKSSTQVLMCWEVNTSEGARAVVLSVSGTTITANTTVQVVSNSCSYLDVACITTNKYVLCLTNKSGFGYAYILTTNGTTVTVGGNGSFSSTGNHTTKYNSVAVYSTTHIVVSFLDKLTQEGCAMVIDVSSSSSPVRGTRTYYYENNNVDIDIVNTRATKDFIFYSNESSVLYGLKHTISGTTISFGTKVQLAIVCKDIDVVTYDGTKTFLAYATTSDGTTQLVQLTDNKPSNTLTFTSTTNETQVRKATSLPCDGIAKTTGTGGTSTAHKDRVTVYIPKI